MDNPSVIDISFMFSKTSSFIHNIASGTPQMLLMRRQCLTMRSVFIKIQGFGIHLK